MRTTFDAVMRVVSTLIGVLMVLMGSVWLMQGLQIGPSAIMQGFMVGSPSWVLYGAILALFGIGQVVWSNTRRR